jgi:hypothetical protein
MDFKNRILSRINFLTVCISVILLMLNFVTFAKLPVYKSLLYTRAIEKITPEKVAINFDKKGKLWFGTASNDTVFFIRVIFQEQTSVMKLMRGGLNVYFDPSGKKKKNYALMLERSEMPQGGQSRMGERGERGERGMGGERGKGGTGTDQRMRNPATMIGEVLTKASWIKNGHSYVFNRSQTKSPIRIDFTANDQNQLVYVVCIPMKELSLEKGQQIFSLGIETVEIEQPDFQGSGGRSGGMSGGGRGEMGGGGMSGGNMGGGGMRGGGMSGGRMGGPGMSGGDSSTLTPIKLWFQVQL